MYIPSSVNVIYKIYVGKKGYTVKYAVQPHIDPADRIQPDTGVAHCLQSSGPDRTTGAAEETACWWSIHGCHVKF